MHARKNPRRIFRFSILALACGLLTGTLPALAEPLPTPAVQTETQEALQAPLWQYTMSEDATVLPTAEKGKLLLVSKNKLDILQDGLATGSLPLPADKAWQYREAVVSSNGDVYIPARNPDCSSSVYLISVTSGDIREVFHSPHYGTYSETPRITITKKHLYIGISVAKPIIMPDKDVNTHDLFSLDMEKITRHPGLPVEEYLLYRKVNTGDNASALVAESADGRTVFTAGRLLDSQTGEVLLDTGKYDTATSLLTDDHNNLWMTDFRERKLSKNAVFDTSHLAEKWSAEIPYDFYFGPRPLAFNTKTRQIYLLNKTHTNTLYTINADNPGKLQAIPVPAPYTTPGLPVIAPVTGNAYMTGSHYSKVDKTYVHGLLRLLPDNTTQEMFRFPETDEFIYNPVIHGDKIYVRSGGVLYAFDAASADTVPLQPQQNIDGNILSDNERSQPHRISWEVLDKDNRRVESASGHLDIDGADPMLLDPFRWPMLVSEAINRQGGMLKAGPKNGTEEAGPATPIASQYRNWLWLPEDKIREGYHVEPLLVEQTVATPSEWHLNTGSQQAFTSQEGDSLVGRTVIFTVTRNGKQASYPVTTQERNRFLAMQDIARQANATIPDVRLGEKISGNTITPLTSQYRNKIWVKSDSSGNPVATVSWRME